MCLVIGRDKNDQFYCFQPEYFSLDMSRECALYHGAGSLKLSLFVGDKEKSEILRICSFCAAAPEFSHLYFKVQKELSQLHNSSVDTVVCPSVPSSVILILLTMIKHYFCSLYIHIIHNDGLISGAFENISKVFLFKIVVEYSSNMLPSRSC